MAVRLPRRRIGGQLAGDDGQARHNDGGLDLDLRECEVGQLVLDRGSPGGWTPALRYGDIFDGPTVAGLFLRWFADPRCG